MAGSKPSPKEIQVSFPEQLKGGAYCNYMVVTHTKEEFILDFMMITPPIGAEVSRVIMSPGHIKRTIAALQTNVKKYEEKFGGITAAEEPAEGRIGFRTT